MLDFIPVLIGVFLRFGFYLSVFFRFFLRSFFYLFVFRNHIFLKIAGLPIIRLRASKSKTSYWLVGAAWLFCERENCAMGMLHHRTPSSLERKVAFPHHSKSSMTNNQYQGYIVFVKINKFAVLLLPVGCVLCS